MRHSHAMCMRLLAVLIVIGGCRQSPVSPCADDVGVRVSSGGQKVAVGDTVRVSAALYNSAFGFFTSCRGDYVWTISDSTIARLEPTSRNDERIARGLRVGTVTIRAAIDGKTGQSPLNVVP